MAVRIESQAEPIPGYKLLERLGGGGFGEVWKAVAPGGLLKAIKFVYGNLKTDNDEGVRAEQELKALSRVKTVRHPYILSLERYDIIDGQLLIVMELADRNLYDRFKECRDRGLTGIPRDELLRYMDEIAEALDLMNEHYQLQHLDIKPQNLFLVHNHVKVADFGLVKDLEGVMASVTGGVTPVYAAPETFDGWVSRFCDQYSLAIVYQELLTGHRPFASNNIRQLIHQHLSCAPDLSALPTYDQAIISRSLAKNPDDRYPSCTAMVTDLHEASGNEPRQGRAAPESGRGNAPARTPTPRSNPRPPAATPTPSEAGALVDSEPEVRPYSEGDTRWIRVNEVAAGESAEAEPQDAVPEIRGQGILFPALVIGLGDAGLGVLKSVREHLHVEFGGVQVLPHIRLLFLDTDPDALRKAAEGSAGGALPRNEVMLARLGRPSHYLRSREGRTLIEAWFNRKMLYRIPRSLVTTGVRALGRLAFFDNYRAIAHRLRTELEYCQAKELAAAAAQATGLGMKTNQTRVYVIASLAGGTGGGMFLDLAYVVRHTLKQLGVDRPDVVGVFLLPEVDRHPSRAQALGNTFAALTELNHFSAPTTRFKAQYIEKEKPLNDPEPPFSRCIALPMPRTAEDSNSPVRQGAKLAAEYLFRDLVTPLGKTADAARALLPLPAQLARSVVCQTFGLQRISYPRQLLLRNAASGLCRKIVGRWISKDATAIRAVIEQETADFWDEENLGADAAVAMLEKACEERLGKPVESIFSGLVDPLLSLIGNQTGPVPPPDPFRDVLDRICQVVGRPDGVGIAAGQLTDPLDQAADALTGQWGGKLAALIGQEIERPDHRLAGAEESVRQLIGRMEEVLKHHEPLYKELAKRSIEVYFRIEDFLEALAPGAAGNKKAAERLPDLIELLRVYPRWTLQSLVLQRVAAVFVSLRGSLSDQLRETNFCRDRLIDLQLKFEESAQSRLETANIAVGRTLYPDNCRSLVEAVDRLVEAVGPDAQLDLDERIQRLIQEQFIALVHVCLTSANMLKTLEPAMQHVAEGFMGEQLENINVAEVYLSQVGQGKQACQDLLAVFSQAAPKLGAKRASQQEEICILGVPGGPAGEQLRALAEEALDDKELVVAPSRDDIIFYREMPHIAIGDLEQMGPLAFEAYTQLAGIEDFTPHSRSDILEWRAAPSGPGHE